MSMAREFKAIPRSRPHTTMTGIMTNHVGPKTVATPVRGAKTKTDRAPMSTTHYKHHVARYDKLLNGAGNKR